MKRFLWMATILALVSCCAFADTIISLIPNSGSGDNFFALQRNGADYIEILGGTAPPTYYGLEGYPPGSGLGGPADLYIDDGGLARIGGQLYSLEPISVGTLDMTGFTFPTNGQSFFQVGVSIDFSVDMMIVETGDPLTVSGSTSGHMAFFYSPFDGNYYPDGGFMTPEPGTLGLVGTGLLGVLTLARRRLRSR